MSEQGRRLTVLVAEDNADLCDAVCALVGAEPDMEVVAAVAHPAGLLDKVRNSGARCIVLDLNLSGESSVPALGDLRVRAPEVGVVIFSGYDRCDIEAALPISATCEFVSKTGDTAVLLDAIRRVCKNTAAGTGIEARLPPH
jgi:DNA-binding NarL/FixJ family response regulator